MKKRIKKKTLPLKIKGKVERDLIRMSFPQGVNIEQEQKTTVRANIDKALTEI